MAPLRDRTIALNTWRARVRPGSRNDACVLRRLASADWSAYGTFQPATIALRSRSTDPPVGTGVG